MSNKLTGTQLFSVLIGGIALGTLIVVIFLDW